MSDKLSRFLGGEPIIVILKLVLISIGIGVLLSFLGLNPYRLLYSIENLITFIWESGFEIVERVWRYFLLGAVLVVPIWLIMRFFSAKSAPPSKENHSQSLESRVEKQP
jgi:Family of unknown function (DUF6460)